MTLFYHLVEPSLMSLGRTRVIEKRSMFPQDCRDKIKVLGRVLGHDLLLIITEQFVINFGRKFVEFIRNSKYLLLSFLPPPYQLSSLSLRTSINAKN